MQKGLDEEVRKRGRGLCEYCRLPETASPLKHVIDHVVARQHGGTASLKNLALCCGRCNQHKGPNISGVDPDTGRVTRLFHPRRDNWERHFQWEGAVLTGITPVGRTTVLVLAVNQPFRVAGRQALIDAGAFPPH
jgi:hypothetical protein